MQRDNKKRGREVSEEKKIQEKCAKKKMHQKNTDKSTHRREEDNEVVELSVFDFPWIKDGTMFSTIPEEDWNFEGTFLSSLRAAIEDGEFFSQFSCRSPTGLLEFLPEIVDDGKGGGNGDACLIPTENPEALDQGIWASVLNQPLGRV